MMRSCSYCGKVGHTIETCYHKYGFPPHLQKKFGVANVNNMIVAEKTCGDGNVTDVRSTQEENSKSLDNLFSEDKKQALISLFQQHKGDPAHSSLQTQAINTVIAPSADATYVNLGAKNRELVNTSNLVSVAAVTYTINHETWHCRTEHDTETETIGRRH
ncbi:uncharacterized protein DS421_12g382440 [Arachis hypogaea]|nr:uncharacterized protein DS421_12g382440 [Arachis hypogaea]